MTNDAPSIPTGTEEERLLADAAFYIRRMASLLKDHPSRVQLRAVAFVNEKLAKYERHIVPMNELLGFLMEDKFHEDFRS